MRLFKAVLLGAALLALPVSVSAADCVPQSVLTWVDNREAVAISPTRWQNVRKSLLEQDGGMPLADMETIYNRRVSRGWAAGHWVPILDAMNCLKDQAAAAAAQAEAEAKAKAEAEAKAQAEAQPAPQVEPAQAEVEPAQEPTADLSQPPASFIYFDDRDEMESGGENWSRYGRRTHNEWIRPNGGTANQTVQAWNKWGPWDDLAPDVQQSIHDSIGLDHDALASGCGGFDSGGLACTALGEDLQAYNLNLNKWSWRGNFTNYTLYPPMAKAWEIADTAPRMVFEYNPSDQYAPWFAYVEYTRTNGQVFSGEHWYGLRFEDGSVKDKNTQDGPGDDGLSATFYRKNDYFPQYSDALPANAFLVGEVRRPKIIGTFKTGTGQGQ